MLGSLTPTEGVAFSPIIVSKTIVRRLGTEEATPSSRELDEPTLGQDAPPF